MYTISAGSDRPAPYVPGTGPGAWQPTSRPNPSPPPAELPGLPAAAPQWATVTPFGIPSRGNPNPPANITAVRGDRQWYPNDQTRSEVLARHGKHRH